MQWICQLLFRRPRNVPEGLRTIWWLSWILLFGAGIAAAFGQLGHVMQSFGNISPYSLISLLLLALAGLVQGLLIYYAGDAARYLSPSPQNIKLRQRIRAEGVELLRRLHESGEYNRIIVVGHSLGSVIGYDILNALWRKHHIAYDFKGRDSELDALLANNDRPQPVLRDAIATLGEALRSLPIEDTTRSLRNSLQHAFRAAQLACWKEQRVWGNTWLITDFVTLGSPLAHAMMLLARSDEEFAARKRQRELPTCPPIAESNRYAYAPDEHIETSGGRKFSPLVLHHAACFAVTRWTNLYFPAFLGLFGDAVGGPLAKVFGPGVRDIPVKSDSIRQYTLAAHTTYWNPQSDVPKNTDSSHIEFALPALKQALHLDYAKEFTIPESAVDNTSHDALVALNQKMDEMLPLGADATQFFADLLSDQFLFYHAGEPASNKPASNKPAMDQPVMGILDSTGFLESLKQAGAFTAYSTNKITVTPIERKVLVTLDVNINRTDDIQAHFRHLRLFSQSDNRWKLETWYCFDPRIK